MKIPLTVRTYSEGLKPFCEVHFAYEPPHGRKIRGVFDAFVDTGSPYTIVCQTDAVKMGLCLTGEGRQIYLGGAPILLYPIHKPSLKVMCDNKSICDIGISTVHIASPIEGKKKSMDVNSYLKSIIGMDLLIENKLALFFDPGRGVAYLENPDK